MRGKRKLLLIVVLAAVIAVHLALFAAGGSWRTVGMVLVAVDVFSGLFILGGMRELRKLDQRRDPE